MIEMHSNDKTAFQGLWYDPVRKRYVSYPFLQSDVPAFDGFVQLEVRENKFYGADNKQAPFVWCLTKADGYYRNKEE